MAVAGENSQVETLIDNLANRRPEDTWIRFQYAPMIHATVQLNHGDAERAIRILEPGISYDLEMSTRLLARANAFLRAGHAAEAVQEFGRIVALRTRYPYDPACAVAQLGSARAYALAGDKPSSDNAYQEFLRRWKNADPTCPCCSKQG